MVLKKILAAVLLLTTLISVLLPAVSGTEDTDVLILAQTLYAIAQDESDSVMMNVGSIVMNRTESVWFPDSVQAVLDQQHQFARGTRYDDRSLDAAQKLLSGSRTLPSDAVYFDLNAFGNGVGEAVALDETYTYYAQK